MAADYGVDVEEIVKKVLDNPRNLATEKELLEQANSAIINFQNADADSSATITFEELSSLCELMGLPVESDLDAEFDHIDADGLGSISVEEWVLWWLNKVSVLPNPAKQQEAIARNTFKKFDTDGSGALDSSELGKLLITLGASFTATEMEEVIRQLDTGGDETIELSEFLSWWVDRAVKARSGKTGGLVALKLRKLANKAAQMFFTDIFTATWNGDLELVKLFLQSDRRMARASDESDYGDDWTPLHYACYQGVSEIVDELIDAGANVNATTKKGFTPMFYAAQRNHVDICRKLLALEADPTIAGVDPDDPLNFMCPVEHHVDSPELYELLKDHPKCQPPREPPVDRVEASIISGVLSFNTPPPNKFTHLPVKKWYVKLSWVDADGVKLGSETTDTGIESLTMYVLAQPPTGSSSGSDVTAPVDKKWLRLIPTIPNVPPPVVILNFAAINALKDIGPFSADVVVKYKPSSSSSLSKADNADSRPRSRGSVVDNNDPAIGLAHSLGGAEAGVRTDEEEASPVFVKIDDNSNAVDFIQGSPSPSSGPQSSPELEHAAPAYRYADADIDEE